MERMISGVLKRLVLVSLALWALAWGVGQPPPAAAADRALSKAELRPVMSNQVRRLATGRPFTVPHPKLGPLVVDPAIDPILQSWAENLLSGVRDLRAAIVVVEAETGRVLVLAGVEHGRLSPSVALDSDAPAASLFKVVTAAAALEEAGMDPMTSISFVGRPHTLYRYQVRQKTRSRPAKETLRKSFAHSNNPVFARLGIYHLGEKVLVEYAKALGFARTLDSELPVDPSRLSMPCDAFTLGELACGYNRTTTTNPLHAALMVSVFLNGGRFPEPYLIEKVTASDGRVLYRGRPDKAGPVVGERTRRDMQDLMEATVEVGTARRSFRKMERDRVLKELDVGGKTGTIRGPDRTELFQWFAGYGHDPASGRKLAVCTLVVHGKHAWANPRELARQMIREAFNQKSVISQRGRRAVN